MRALARLESVIQDLVERPAWLLTKRRLHPIEMAAALTRALESDALPLADRVLVPDGYALRLHTEDYAQFSTVRRTLEREFAEYLSRVVEERGLALNAPITVAIVESHTVRSGMVEVTTGFSEHRPAATAPSPREPTRTTPAAPSRRPSATVRGQAMLEVLDENGAVLFRRAVDGDGLVIGRRTSSGLTLPDVEVSRQHAQIEPDTAGFSLHDLDSMNGTAVNGRRITGRHLLRDGDVIEVGHTRLRFVQGG
jgi:hypothetical protein